MKMDPRVNLKLDRAKIDPNFDGYKLSLDSLPTYKLTLEFQPECTRLSSQQFSYQHVKCFGNINSLISDPCQSESVYFVDERLKIMMFSAIGDTDLQQPRSVLQIPNAIELRSMSERAPPTISFPSADIAFINTGTGLLYVAQTFDRQEGLMWKIVHSFSPMEEHVPSTLLHSTSFMKDNTRKVECLILHVDSTDHSDEAQINKKNKHLFKSVIEWLTFTVVESKDDINFELERTRRLEGIAPPDYSALESDGQGITIASENKFVMVYDSVKPVVEKAHVPESATTPEETTHSYKWNQTAEDVNIFFTLPPECTKSDIVFKLKQNNIHVGLKTGDAVLLDGSLCDDVDVDESTWMITNSEIKSGVGDFVQPDQLRLHVILTKKDGSSTWSSVVVGDDRGKMLTEDANIEEAFEIVQKTMETEEFQKPAYNAQQLEECDDFPDEHSALLRIDGESHEITHQVNMSSHQWLFNCPADMNKPPGICIRHDVDGVVWQPTTIKSNVTTDEKLPWQHIATFNAFGYVQASKQQRQFTTCSPNFSYAVISDSVRHVYIYWQPSAITSPIRNRKTGETVNSVAKQQLVSLETVETITGLYASSRKLFIVAGNIMHVLNVKHDELM